VTAPAIETQAVSVGFGDMPYPRPHRGPETFGVVHEGRRVGEMWKYGTGKDVRWRAYREGHGSSLPSHPTQEAAAAEVGWTIHVNAAQLPYKARQQNTVRIVSRDGDVLTLTMCEADDDRQVICCTAYLTSDAAQTALNEGGCAAVRQRVADQFGVHSVSGGARGTTGDPVVLFFMPSNHKVTLHP
jgi:hypothetical protein